MARHGMVTLSRSKSVGEKSQLENMRQAMVVSKRMARFLWVE